ncbi:snare associated Golgi protein-domain-containing protein, partial [Melampsora americana]
VYQRQIIIGLGPFSKYLRELKLGNLEIGWIIPIIMLIIISFPPLIGHEIVILICGLVWGLWWGFAIGAIGTFLGELANFFVFRNFCRERAVKYEEKSLRFATLSLVIRQGGFWITLLARLSAIPSHLLTPVFATSGMNVWIFSTATILSSPKQLSHVYLGTLFQVGKSKTTNSGKLVSFVVFLSSSLVTILAAAYIYWRMKKVKGLVLENRMNSHRSNGTSANDQFVQVEQYDLIFRTHLPDGIEAGSTLKIQGDDGEKIG